MRLGVKYTLKAVSNIGVKLLIVMSIFLSSCGYKVGNLNRSMPEEVKLVAVPTFKNATGEAGLEGFFTNAVLEEIIKARFVKLAPQKKAEAVLEGKVISIRYVPQGTNVADSSNNQLPTGTALTSSYDVQVVVNLRLRRRSDNKILWATTVSGSRTYQAAQIGESGFNSANAIYNYSAKKYTMGLLSKSLMTQAFSRMTEGF